MKTVGLGLHYEDLPMGLKFKTIGRTIYDADLCNFVNVTHIVEVMFTNSEFIRTESDIKGRFVPGSLVYTFAEGLLVQSTMQMTAYAFLGMDMKIERPTMVGDTIHVECEVIEARLSKNRPGRGLIRTRNQVVRQNGDTVLTYTPLRMVKCKEKIL